MNVNLRHRRYRTIWISDVHLGTKGCKSEHLLDFLRHNDSETLYLVGDIIDGWRLKRSWYWDQSHNDIIQKLLRKARKGTNVIYVPGNHDEAARDYCDLHFGGVLVLREAVHRTADGRELLVLHGDEFDVIVRYARWLAILGDWTYAWLLRMNDLFNTLRRHLGYPYWSLSAFLKMKVKDAMAYVSDYQTALAHEARRRRLDGVVCGHIHVPNIVQLGDVIYCNDGDWVESCSALVEHFDGRLEIVHWYAEGPAHSTGLVRQRRETSAARGERVSA